MASYVGAIEKFNPYIQQIPTEAYTKVGMFKEQQYEAGAAKVQESINRVAGLDIANEGGRAYLQNRVDELTSNLNKYSMIDFSNPNNVTQLTSLSKPLLQDENIVSDVTNTIIYRKWSKEASEAYKAGKMELGQYMRETTDASHWLNSKVAGSDYTGRSTPNTATRKDLMDRIIKYKKDGLEKNEYVYDVNYSKDTPYYVKSTNKYYSEADFNNFVANNIISERDREMLMNGHWYENQGKSTLELQQEDLAMYQSKIDANLRQIEAIKNDPLLYAGDKKTESERVIADLEDYNNKLVNGKVAFLQNLNLNDPSSRDVFHRDISENNFISSLNILRDETKKGELQKNEQWFLEKKAELDAALEGAKNAGKSSTSGTDKKKTVEEQMNEVSVFTPVDPAAPKTEVSLNTIKRGWQNKNDQINSTLNNLIGKLHENGVNINEYIAGWDQVQAGTKGGSAVNVPRFRDQASKDKFYNLVSGLNYAYTKEAEDGHIDNKSFINYLKTIAPDYVDTDPNSKFTLQDKMISDALNSLKGTSALLPKLEGLFADKGVVKALSDIDSALRDKKNMANAYREALMKSNALGADEMRALRGMTDDDLLGQSFFLDKKKEAASLGQRGYKASYSAKQESDGSFAIYQNIIEDPNNDFAVGSHDKVLQEDSRAVIGDDRLVEKRKLAGGFKSFSDANKAFKEEGQLSLYNGISKNALDKAEEYIKKTYSYVQENLNSTVQNLKNDKEAYSAVQDGLKLFINRAKRQATSQDIEIDGVEDLRAIAAITDVDVLGASVNNSEDIFNPNPVYEVNITTSQEVDGKEVKTVRPGRISLKSFLATNPNYKTAQYAKYFAPMLYAEKDAYENIKSAVNPLEGSEGSYSNRKDINPVYNFTTQQGGSRFAYDDGGNDIQWETIPIERDGKQTMVSYQVVSLGQNAVLGNLKNKDGQQYQNGAYYIKMKVPTSNGKPKTIFLKRPNGDSYVFNNASYAHYMVKDLIFNNPDIKMEELDPKTGQPNYFTIDPSTLRGIFNAQLSYNGFSKIEMTKFLDALGKEQQKQQIAQNELQFTR